MEKKITAGVSLALLSLAFGIVSLLVIITKRNPYFIKRKLQIGALLLTLSGISAGCRPFSTCYVPAPDNRISIDQADKNSNCITLTKPVLSDTLTGMISSVNGTEFSYALFDSFSKLIIKNDILSKDGSFDEGNEEFSIGFEEELSAGQYKLNLYSLPKDSIETAVGYENSYLIIVKE